MNNTRRIQSADVKESPYKTPAKIAGREITVHKDITESDVPVRIKAGPVDMTIPATTFTWSVKNGDDLITALRPFIHERLRGLPGHHFVAIEGEIGNDHNLDPTLHGIKITVIVPEKQP
ncbi:MAG: hypothetical protein EOQ56_28275 [Mesorhizobium sp.]|nr:MAG: hypothetical protein EOQ56_28275 [Mesorhizobium sp.]